MKARHAGPQRHRPADLRHGPGVLALLMVQHAEQVQGIGILLLGRASTFWYKLPAAVLSLPAWCI